MQIRDHRLTTVRNAGAGVATAVLTLPVGARILSCGADARGLQVRVEHDDSLPGPRTLRVVATGWVYDIPGGTAWHPVGHVTTPDGLTWHVFEEVPVPAPAVPLDLSPYPLHGR